MIRTQAGPLPKECLPAAGRILVTADGPEAIVCSSRTQMPLTWVIDPSSAVHPIRRSFVFASKSYLGFADVEGRLDD
jgi:hypothetical protein